MVEWTDETDLELVVTVEGEKNVQDGLRAAADKLGTTFFAVRNRWYSQAVKELRGWKEDGRRKPRTPKAKVADKTDVFIVLDNMKSYFDLLDRTITDEVSSLRYENIQLKEDKAELERKCESLELKYAAMEEDFSVMSKVFNRARQMVADDEATRGSKYKIDRDGNIEKLG